MEPVPQQFSKVLANKDIMRMVLSIMLLHLILTTSFFALPISLFEHAGLPKEQHAMAYLPILIAAFITMVPFIIIAEKRRKMKPIFIGAVVVLGIVQVTWAFVADSVTGIMIGLWLFFTAFNILEASLPSLMSKLSPLENKGTALGIYSTAQFLGAFIGGGTGGLLYGQFGVHGVFIAGAIVCIVWLFFIIPMSPPRHLSTRIIELSTVSKDNANDIARQLNAIVGVVETMIVESEKVAYVKFVPEEISLDELDAFSYSS
jgi:predicted MFS family arabinose efflux permease